VDEVRSMPIEVVASCHSPTIRGARIDRAFELLRGLPDMEPWQSFAHHELEQWVSAMAAEGAQ
jgi:hypothetical protein